VITAEEKVDKEAEDKKISAARKFTY
jgi:hypothetical protein